MNEKFDKRGNCIYEVLNGIECWREFDKRGNKIHSKCSDGYEEWNKYDNNDNRIHFIDSSNREYLKKANISRYRKYESWTEYDKNNNRIHFKNSNNGEGWYKFENGEEINITEKEFDEIKCKKEEEIEWKKKVSKRSYRFKIMDI